MQTTLAPEFRGTPEGIEAESILRACVHCGFCTATCPTYQLLGDELDGPRGRIYLIKQVLEGEMPTRKTQLHLDRCLTCRNCESTCPSGVRYGALVEIGRNVVERKVERPAHERAARWALKEGLTSPLFAPALKLGRLALPLVPPALKRKVAASSHAQATTPRARQWPTRRHERKVLMLRGCVQPAMAPNIDSATARVLDACGVQAIVADSAGCCGAIRAHLADRTGALADMRRNVDAWWPLVARGEVEAIVMNASGCGVTVREYGHSLKDDPAYAERAARVGEATQDLSEFLAPLLSSLSRSADGTTRRVAFHSPCTLQHGQQLRGAVESILGTLGFDVHMPADSHLCCGSAGTYSVLQPELANALRDRKLASIEPLAPHAIVSANIGCIQHLQSGTRVPVRHWIELIDDALHA